MHPLTLCSTTTPSWGTDSSNPPGRSVVKPTHKGEHIEIRLEMAYHLRENRASRQSQEPEWYEADPFLAFPALLGALGRYKVTPTNYGLNETIHTGWRFGDPHKRIGWWHKLMSFWIITVSASSLTIGT